jgi:hypothetical protein
MQDLIKGKTIRWTYDDGPMAGKEFEHTFGEDGHVSYHEAGKPGGNNKPTYEVERINDDVCVVSYLGAAGYTLTSVLDRKTGHVTSFASNEKQLIVQHGTFTQG